MLSTAKLVVAPDWELRLGARNLNDFDALWNLSGDVVKRTHSTEVLRIALAPLKGDAPAAARAVFLKKYRVTTPNQLLSGIARGALFGQSKVQREFENMQHLRRWGLDAPAPVAWGEQRRVGWLTRSLLASEGIPDAVPLDRLIVETFAPHLNPLPPSGERKQAPLSHSKGEGQGEGSIRRELLAALADYVRRLHAHRFEHHDLYWRNIILSGGDLGHFYLLDAHMGRVWETTCEQKARAQDLATLDAPAPVYFRRTERLRFLLRYLNKDRLDEETKVLARSTLRLAKPMRTRQIARVRDTRL